MSTIKVKSANVKSSKMRAAFKKMQSGKKVTLTKKGIALLESSKKGVTKIKPTIISVHVTDKVDLSFDGRKNFSTFYGIPVDCIKLK